MQNPNVLLGRLAAASVVCTPFWLPIVNDWHAWSTGLVVTLGDVPLLGFTLLAAPKTFRSITERRERRERRVRRPSLAGSEQATQDVDEHQPDRYRTATFGIDPYLLSLVLLLIALTVSAVAHPHIRGLQTLWRVLAMICLADTVIRRRVRAVTIVHALVGIATLETAMAIWQRITHAPVGLGILGESPVPFYGFGNNGFAVNGTLPHPYPLAALALVSGSAAMVFGGRRLISFRVASLGVATSAIIIGLTISRSGLLSAAGIIVGTLLSVLLTWRRGLSEISTPKTTGTTTTTSTTTATSLAETTTTTTTTTLAKAQQTKAVKPEYLVRLALVGIFTVGLAGSMIASKAAWSNRATVQTQGQSVNDMSSARGDRMSEALGIFKLNPVLGVGPGRYVIALASRPELLHSSPEDALPAHNAALLLLAEGGIPTALALLVVASVLGRRVFALGTDGIILTAAVFPFLMLDIVFVSLPSGLFLIGVWGALISALIFSDPAAAS
jgi:O-Antigen ligase